MKSKIDKILPKLQEKYPNVDIPFLIQHYFDIAKKEVEDFTRPEIAFPWGTLKLRVKEVQRRIKNINILEKNFNTPINKVTKEDLTSMQIERNELKRVLEVHTQYKTKGKTSRSFARQGKKKKNQL